jgi:hypothetical protein
MVMFVSNVNSFREVFNSIYSSSTSESPLPRFLKIPKEKGPRHVQRMPDLYLALLDDGRGVIDAVKEHHSRFLAGV